MLQNTYLGTGKEIYQTQLDSQKKFSNTNFLKKNNIIQLDFSIVHVFAMSRRRQYVAKMNKSVPRSFELP